MNYNVTYDKRSFKVEVKDQTRTVAFENGKAVKGSYQQFNIYEGDRLISFVFDAPHVFTAIRELVDFPNQSRLINSRWD
jgi:hypothetical protein